MDREFYDYLHVKNTASIYIINIYITYTCSYSYVATDLIA